MKIETSFNVGDKVYFLHDNKVTSECINSISIVVKDIDSVHVKYSIRVTPSITINKKEGECFASKEELLKSL